MTTDSINSPKHIGGFTWVAIISAALLTIPLVAMQFTNEVDWKFGDFIIMAAMLFGIGSAFVLISRKVQRRGRIVAGALLAILFLWLWAELSVGIFTDWGA